MGHPKDIKTVALDGHSLTLESFVAAARYGAAVELTEEAREAMARSRALAEKIAGENRVAYGITTGFGDFATVAVPEEMSSRLSTNLILSHCTATGEPYAEEVVRGMMLLRANALCVGVSGVRPILVELLVEMLNRGVIPVVPQKGSLGASGDLAPLSHMGLVLLGRGEAVYQGEVLPGAEAMKRAGLTPLETLVSKEGLGVTNGTCAMTSVGALNLYDTIQAAKLADLVASMSLTALTGQLDAFQERMHTVRGQIGQIQVAKNIRLLTEGCEILRNCQHARVQDAYALRCIPQVHGAVRDTLEFVKAKVDIELNAVTDNPHGPALRLFGHRLRGAGQHLRAAHGADGERRPLQRPDPVPHHRGRGEQRLYDRAVLRGLHGIGEQGPGPPGQRGLHPLLRQPGGLCLHGHHRRPEGGDHLAEHPVRLGAGASDRLSGGGHPPPGEQPRHGHLPRPRGPLPEGAPGRGRL